MLYHRRLGSQGLRMGDSVSGRMVMAELSESQLPDSWESGGFVTLVTKTHAVRHCLLREGSVPSTHKLWTYESSVHLSPHWQKYLRSQRMESLRVPLVAIMSHSQGHIEERS